ncbi:MAG: diguanylate cyclase, partial [Terriglobia bacterium]
MKSTLLRTLATLLLPGGFLLLGAAAVVRFVPAETLDATVRIYPLAVWIAGVLLGWRFNRSSVMLAILVMALTDQALLWMADAGPAAGEGQYVWAIAGLLLPVNLTLLSLVDERGPLGRRLGVGLGLLAGQIGILVLLGWLAGAEVASWLTRKFLAVPWLMDLAVGLPALVAFVLSLAFLAVRTSQDRRVVDHGFLWAVAAALLAFETSLAVSAEHACHVATFYLSTAGLVLVVTVVEASHGLAYRDELTRLPGRRAMNEALERLGEYYAVAMVDIDHFKKFNDTYGHDVGDQVLRMVAGRLERVGGGGRAYRYGGEEFALLYPGKTAARALPHLEAVREEIERSRFKVRGADRPWLKGKTKRGKREARRGLSVTVSIGV